MGSQKKKVRSNSRKRTKGGSNAPNSATSINEAKELLDKAQKKLTDALEKLKNAPVGSPQEATANAEVAQGAEEVEKAASGVVKTVSIANNKGGPLASNIPAVEASPVEGSPEGVPSEEEKSEYETLKAKSDRTGEENKRMEDLKVKYPSLEMSGGTLRRSRKSKKSKRRRQ
jgi:hypothetical protein